MNNNNDALYLAKQGINKQELLAHLTNDWELTSVDLINYDVHSYTLRKWAAVYARSIINEGCIMYEGTKYCVIYRSCTPASLSKATDVKVSFRASVYGNFALIQPTL